MPRLLWGKFSIREKPTVLPQITFEHQQVFIIRKPVLSSKHLCVALDAIYGQNCYTNWKQQADTFRCGSFNASTFSLRSWVVACRGLTFSFIILKSVISLLNFCSLVFKFVATQRNLEWGFHCIKINSVGRGHPN